MRGFARGLAVVFMFVVVAPTTAQAQYPLDDCPGSYAQNTSPYVQCDAPGSDVCTVSGSKWDCAVNGQFTAYADKITAVHGDPYGDHAIAWGEVDGTPFCCLWDQATTTLDDILIDADDGADEVYLKQTYQGTPFYWLGTSVIDAGDGDDIVVGSDYACSATNCNTTGICCDDITTGDGADLVTALAGNDKITGDGYSGTDTSSGGDGSDLIIGGSDDDVLSGNDGEDYLFGGGGDASMYGGDNDDHLWGGDDNDLIRGGSGDDTAYGQDGDDEMHGDSNTDYLDGGDDYDEVHGGTGNNDVVCGGGGVGDLVTGGGGSGDACYDGQDYDPTYTCDTGPPSGVAGYCP